MENCIKLVIFIVIALVVVITIALITSSYADLEYHEYGFVKSTTTGQVDTSKVYDGGRYWPGPAKTFKSFNSSAHVIALDDVTVFTSIDKLEITLGIQLSYFLVKEHLKDLHDEYDVNYETLVQTTATAALKDAANQFTLTQFYEERENVEKALHEGVQKRLSGTCCPPDCKVSLCLDDCVSTLSCETDEKGIFVDARYLQLTSIRIPTQVELRNIKALVLTEETARETFIQQASVIIKETEQQVDEIINRAAEVTANATAQSQLIAAKASAKYQKILEEAKYTGLKILYDGLGYTDTQHKASFLYLSSLSEHKTAHLTVNFDQMIMASDKFTP